MVEPTDGLDDRTDLETEIHERGFTTVALLDAVELDSWRHLYDANDAGPSLPLVRTLADSTRERATAIDLGVKALIAPHLARMLPGHRSVVGLFVHKAPAIGASVPFHQDWSLTDESRHRSLMWWIALDDCTAANGGLAVIPGSHRWTSGARPHSIVSQPTDPYQDELASMAVQLELPRGTAVVYDPALLHGSPPNASSEPRLAALVGTVPSQSRLLHFFEDSDGVHGWEVTESFYSMHEHGKPSETCPPAELWSPIVGSDDIRRALDEHRSLHTDAAGRHSADAAPSSREDPTTTDSPTPRPNRRSTRLPLLAAAAPGRLRSSEPVLLSSRLDRSLRLNGFVVTSLLAGRGVAELRTAYGELHGFSPRRHFEDQPPDFEGDFWSSDSDYRRRVGETITSSTGRAIEHTFTRHRPVAATYLVKWPFKPGSSPWHGVPDKFHNDTMYVDERTGSRSFMVWLALQDTDRENGGLQVVPGSHLLPRTIRGLDLEPPWLRHESVFAKRSVNLSLRAGECVIFDPAIVHRSEPNHTGSPRIVATLLLTEPGTQLTYFRATSASLADQVLVEDDFMTTALVDELPGRPADETIALDQKDLTERQLARRLATITAVRRLAGARKRARPRDDRPDPADEPTAKPVLADPQADRELREQGFVVLSPVPAELTTDALATHRRLRGTSGKEFEPDLTNPDTGYRRAVNSALESTFGEAIRHRFVSHEPFLWNFLCKWPHGTESLYLHRDWMFVDEPAGHRSYLAWIPLQDVEGDNGVLQVLPRSHRIDGELSGTGLQPSWLEHESTIRSRLVDVPVKEGDVVVLDHALVHCSKPNRTATPRVIAACALHTPEAELVHYRRESESTVSRYAVDASFFTSLTPQELIESPPPGASPPVASRSPVGAPHRHLSADELSRLLDAPGPPSA